MAIGGSRKYLLASLDQSLGRMGLDYVDIFYSHRFDPETPLEETMGALDAAVRQGKALYVGISSYSAKRTREAAAILRDLGTPLLIHQPSYSMLNRWIEAELLDVLAEERIGAIAFSPLAQGLLTDRYLGGVPAGSRAARGGSFSRDLLTDANLANVRGLNEIAQRRRPDPRPDGARLDRCATRGSRRRWSGRARSSSSTTASRRSRTSRSSLTSSPRSTASPSRAASTCGRRRATPSVVPPDSRGSRPSWLPTRARRWVKAPSGTTASSASGGSTSWASRSIERIR